MSRRDVEKRKDEMTIDQVPDGVKVAVSVGSPVLAFFGYPVEQWGFVLSAIVAFLFIVEKLPMFIKRVKDLIDWIKND